MESTLIAEKSKSDKAGTAGKSQTKKNGPDKDPFFLPKDPASQPVAVPFFPPASTPVQQNEVTPVTVKPNAPSVVENKEINTPPSNTATPENTIATPKESIPEVVTKTEPVPENNTKEIKEIQETDNLKYNDPAPVATKANDSPVVENQEANVPSSETITPETTIAVTEKSTEGVAPNAESTAENNTKEIQETDNLKYLDPTTTEAVLKAKLASAATLASANAKTKSASVKITESIKSQNTPSSEAQASSNEGLVKQLSKNPVPQKKKDAAKKSLDQAVEQSVPTTLKAVDEFKESKKTAVISRSVMGQVKRDVGDVKSGFNAISSKPKPAAAAKGTALPGAEPAKIVNRLNLASGILPAIKKEQLDTADYTKQADDIFNKEGISQQQLDMVDKGDLAEAGLAKKGLDNDAKSQPGEVQEAAAKEHSALNSKMNEIEATSRSDMHKHREQQLKQTGGQQVKAKSELEKKRDEVAKTINDRYTNCQTSITKKLNDLEKVAMASFDQGQQLATTAFEYQVKRDINDFKRRRYTADLKGVYYQGRDWLMGIDDFPEVKKAFNNAKTTYVNRIDALIDTITQKNNEVIAGCKLELETTKKQIADYVKSLDPALKAIGKKTQGEVNGKLEELGKQIEERKEKLQQMLVDKRKSAMEAIDKKIAAMKKKMSGALNILGKLLLDAAKKFFKWALESLGIDAEGFMKTLEKAGQAIAMIFKDPGKFFSNLVAAVKGSIADFRENFKAYLSGGLFDWLTGALGSVVSLPKVWDIQGIFSVILQLAGISWAFIRKKLVALFGEEKIAYAEEKVEVVKKFMTDGVMGIWEWIKDQAETIKTTLIEGIKDWLLTRMVVKFTEWIATLLIPGGAIVRLIEGIYKLVMFFVDNIQRIIKWVSSILDSIASIAAGAIGGAITAIVNSMKVIIPVILDFFAKLLNITGIVDAIQNVIAKIMAPINKAIDRFVEFLKGMLNKTLVNSKMDTGKKEDENKQHTQEKKHKIEEGLNDLVKTQKNYEENGEISYENALKVAKIIKEKNSVFSSFNVIDGSTNWDYEYTASPARKIKGVKKQPKLDNELKDIVSKIKSLPGSKGLVSFIESKKILPWFKYGFKTQAERAIYYDNIKILIYIEQSFKDPSTGKLSRFDLVIKDIDIDGKDTGEEVVVEVKNWTGFEKLERNKQEIRLLNLETQLAKYKRSNKKVLLEWKGKIPESIKALCEDMKVDLKSI